MNPDKSKLHFYIDIVGSCNLRCPSCPVGNSANVANAHGVMSPDTLNRIIEKATEECIVTAISLFNWTEPLLHPRLDEMVRIVNKYGVPCAVSTNLNISNPEHYRKLLEASPNILRISLSGFSQEKYSLTHRGGSIEKVKNNLETLLQLKEKSRSTTRVVLAFHRYISNLDEENEIKAYCENLGLVFLPVNALMLPLEKVLAFCGESSFSTITQDDEKLIANLALPLKPALTLASGTEADSCKLLEQQVTLNCKGEALLCCAAYDEKKFVVGNYLKNSLEVIQKARRQHEACSTCLKHGASNYFLYKIPELGTLVAENIQKFHNRR